MAANIENEDLLGIRDMPLDDAMIKYAADYFAFINNEHNWKEFKMFHNCTETAAQLFARFWDVIMQGITDQTRQVTPRTAAQLLLIRNPRQPPPPAPVLYANVKKTSLFEHEKIWNKERQSKRFNDKAIRDLKKKSFDYLRSQAEPATTQSSRNAPPGRQNPNFLSVPSQISRRSGASPGMPGVSRSPIARGQSNTTTDQRGNDE